MKFTIISALFFAVSIQAPQEKKGDMQQKSDIGTTEGSLLTVYTDKECKDVAVRRFNRKDAGFDCGKDLDGDCIQLDGGTSQTIDCVPYEITVSLDKYVIMRQYGTKDCSGEAREVMYYPRSKEGMCVAAGGVLNSKVFFKINGDKISIGTPNCKKTIEYTKNKCDRFSIVSWN